MNVNKQEQGQDKQPSTWYPLLALALVKNKMSSCKSCWCLSSLFQVKPASFAADTYWHWFCFVCGRCPGCFIASHGGVSKSCHSRLRQIPSSKLWFQVGMQLCGFFNLKRGKKREHKVFFFFPAFPDFKKQMMKFTFFYRTLGQIQASIFGSDFTLLDRRPLVAEIIGLYGQHCKAPSCVTHEMFPDKPTRPHVDSK